MKRIAIVILLAVLLLFLGCSEEEILNALAAPTPIPTATAKPVNQATAAPKTKAPTATPTQEPTQEPTPSPVPTPTPIQGYPVTETGLIVLCEGETGWDEDAGAAIPFDLDGDGENEVLTFSRVNASGVRIAYEAGGTGLCDSTFPLGEISRVLLLVSDAKDGVGRQELIMEETNGTFSMLRLENGLLLWDLSDGLPQRSGAAIAALRDGAIVFVDAEAVETGIFTPGQQPPATQQSVCDLDRCGTRETVRTYAAADTLSYCGIAVQRADGTQGVLCLTGCTIDAMDATLTLTDRITGAPVLLLTGQIADGACVTLLSYAGGMPQLIASVPGKVQAVGKWTLTLETVITIEDVWLAEANYRIASGRLVQTDDLYRPIAPKDAKNGNGSLTVLADVPALLVTERDITAYTLTSGTVLTPTASDNLSYCDFLLETGETVRLLYTGCEDGSEGRGINGASVALILGFSDAESAVPAKPAG